MAADRRVLYHVLRSERGRGRRFAGWKSAEVFGAQRFQVSIGNSGESRGALFAFRGKRGGLVKLLCYDGQGMCLFSKRLEKGHFIWPVTETGRVSLTRRMGATPGRLP